MTGDAARALAHHAATVSCEDLPEAALEATRNFLLDSFGVALAGSAAPWAKELADMQHSWGRGTDARNWAFGTMMPAPAAAFANAYQLHNSEFDCIHEEAVVHPMAVTLPALMAVAERKGGISGREFILALTLGVDIACHIGVAVQGRMRFFRPATAGAFGAVAAIGRLQGFRAETILDAMGAVYSQLCGTMQAHHEGSSLLAMQIGFNARNAVVACDMAAAGMQAPRDMLEGPYGYFSLFESGADFESLRSSLGKIWRITEVAHKPFPTGRATHGVVDALLDLQKSEGFQADAVERVTAHVPPLTYQLVGRLPAADMTANQARLCIAFAGARALLNQGLGIADFQPAALRDATTHNLASRISVSVDKNPAPNALAPVHVEVQLKNGKVLSHSAAVIYGNPAKPMSHEAHLAKFRRNWDSAAVALPPANAERLIDAVKQIESLPDVTALVDLLVP